MSLRVPVQLVGPLLLWAACGRVGYAERDSVEPGTVGTTSSSTMGIGGGGPTDSVTVGTTGGAGPGAGGASSGTGGATGGTFNSGGSGNVGGATSAGGSGGGSSVAAGSGGIGSGGGTSSTGNGGTSGVGGSSGRSGAGGSGAGGSGAGGSGAGGSGAGGGGDAGASCRAATSNGHNYLMCQTYLTQPDAAAMCAANGMRLARVDDAAENQWILNAMYNQVLPPDQVANWIWLGGSDAVTEGSWLWPDGTLFYQAGPVGGLYTNWGQAEPNNARGNEDCMTLRINSFFWTDVDCGEMHHFCCEQY